MDLWTLFLPPSVIFTKSPFKVPKAASPINVKKGINVFPCKASVSQPSLILSWANTEGVVLRGLIFGAHLLYIQGLENARITPNVFQCPPKTTTVDCSVYNPVYILGCKIAAGTKECLWIQDDFISNLFSTINKRFRKKWRKLNPPGDILSFAPVGS